MTFFYHFEVKRFTAQICFVTKSETRRERPHISVYVPPLYKLNRRVNIYTSFMYSFLSRILCLVKPYAFKPCVEISIVSFCIYCIFNI